ncbi:MAG: protein kinase [Planctomycetota bacterium]
MDGPEPTRDARRREPDTVTSPSPRGFRSAEGTAPGTLLGGRFAVVRQLGIGGMGEVLLVRDRHIEDREVALKLVRDRYSDDPRFQDLFYKEIRAAQQFVSEYAVQIRDCGRLAEGQLFLTMDYVDGESLTELMRREKTLRPKHALEITRQILLALSSGHEKGFVHRDVKPSNVMLAAREPKTDENPYGVKVGLLDFGIAGLTQEFKEGKSAGTPRYMSPEQAAGDPLDARSDLFAVGVMLYEMLSGRHLFDGRTQGEITTAVIETDPTPLVDDLDGIGKPIKKILRKALQKKREKRYSSAADFVDAIESSQSFRMRSGAPGWVGALAAVTTATTLGVSWLYFEQQNEQVVDSVDAVRLNGEIEGLKLQLGAAETKIADSKEENDRLRSQGEQSAARIASLELSLQGARRKAESSGREENAARISSLDQRFQLDYQLRVQQAHLADLLGFLDVPLNNLGRELCEAGQSYDRLVAAVAKRETGGRSNVIEGGIEDGNLDAATKGIEFLEQLESLSNEIDRFAAKRSTGSESFAELEGLRQSFDELSSPSRTSSFFEATASTDDLEATKGRWLGLVRRTEAEFIDHLLSVARRAGAPSEESLQEEKIQELMPESEGLSEAEREEAIRRVEEELRSQPTIALKEELWSWIRRENIKNSSWTIYGARVDVDTIERRKARLFEALEALGQQLDELDRGLREDANDRVAEIQEESDLTVRASRTLAFLDAFGESYSREYAPPLVNGLVSDCLAAAITDGRLTMDGLRALPVQLSELADHELLNDESSDEVPESTRTDLRWLVRAMQWYKGDAAGKQHPWRQEFDRALSQRPIASIDEPWKKLLAFQYQIKHESDLARPIGSERAYASLTAGQKVTGWQIMRIDVEGDGREMRNEFRKLNGELTTKSPSISLGVADADAREIEWRNKPLLRIDELPDQVDFVSWTPLSSNARQIFDDSRARAFSEMNRNKTPLGCVQDVYRGAMLSEEELMTCLRIRGSDGRTVLVHPVLGVVREQQAHATFDLVHYEPN